jgi:hypothetical protein
MNYIFALLLAITPIPHTEIQDHTGEMTKALLETFTDEEMAGAGPVVINWAENTDVVYGAMVPYNASNFKECGDASRCVLFNKTWWNTLSLYGDYEEDVKRIYVAHEFGHVLSLERKEVDAEYAAAVKRVDEECLADAVATYVLDRNDWLPSTTDHYNIAYQCTQFWADTYHEDRGMEALALAEDLLYWAAHRWDEVPPESWVPAIERAATATVGATRGEQYAA